MVWLNSAADLAAIFASEGFLKITKFLDRFLFLIF
jgi:hypothetical protein